MINGHKAFACLRHSLFQTILCINALLCGIEGLRPQDLSGQDQSVMDGGEDAPCPPNFFAIYMDDVFGTFAGTSRMTMAQWDQYHTYRFFTYEFYGRTRDGKTSVRGTHHVNAAQCTDAAWSYWSGSPATIALLHNAQFSSLACAGTGENGESEALMAITSSGCEGTGGGGGGGGTTTLRCYTIQVEHYWYYPDTGEFEYRYTDVQTYCEQS
jgi:hypothetical protein